jgi:adenylate cyclase class 2
MTRESELKFLDVDMDELRPRIKSAGGVFEGRWLETNTVFDDPAGRLRKGGSLLRLRTCAGTSHGLLTFKQATDDPCRLKVCEEYETQVLDPAQTETLLAGLGYREVLVYQKVRETWRMDRGLLVCLDLLPFGSFAELEGPEEAVLEAARALGLDLEKSSKETYFEINARVRSEAGLEPQESFVFDDQALEPILDELDAGSPRG